MKEAKSVLLVMDLQAGIVKGNLQDSAALAPFQQAIQTARNSGVPVIFVRVAFRSNYPEVSEKNKIFSAISKRGGFTETDEATQIVPEVAPLPEEPIVVKRRFSAFSGSDLQEILRAKHIDKLVLAGISTSGVILSTVREAADKDFEMVVLSDACADSDVQVHDTLMQKVFPKQAEVMTVQQWQESLQSME
ncbi:cysteine hydrolase family protein [Virgibacillus halophilus]|uniref:Cysteine hydrolase n=1 Tax=Tigheibacillus halophilus TaxID=361280 RepID=A0ABU5C6V6_9BACI|nr:cysteine hydrolase [Virgibacillus halophilus]